MRLPWIASSRTDKQVAGDFLVPSFTKKWSSLESTVREQPSTDRFLIKCDDANSFRRIERDVDRGMVFRPLWTERKIHRDSRLVHHISRLDSSRIAPPFREGGLESVDGSGCIVSRLSRKESLETRAEEVSPSSRLLSDDDPRYKRKREILARLSGPPRRVYTSSSLEKILV